MTLSGGGEPDIRCGAKRRSKPFTSTWLWFFVHPDHNKQLVGIRPFIGNQLIGDVAQVIAYKGSLSDAQV